MTAAKFRSLLPLFAALIVAPGSSVSATEAKITFARDLEEAGRAQLTRLLASYDLTPWIFTTQVKVEAGAEPHSMPILTMNTDHLDNDLRQLSIFIHEQAHWHIYEAEERDAAIAELREAYPDAPMDSDRLYQHLLVAWVELDALVELIGEDDARRVIREKVEVLNRGLSSEVAEQYHWYNHKVLDETEAIGRVLERHGMIVTPGKGLVL